LKKSVNHPIRENFKKNQKSKKRLNGWGKRGTKIRGRGGRGGGSGLVVVKRRFNKGRGGKCEA